MLYHGHVYVVCVVFGWFHNICCAVQGPFQYEEEYHDIIILGAGMSGISVGSKLHESGISDFIILEGQSNIGGRMQTVEFAGHFVNGGASWIEGYCDDSNGRKCDGYSTNPMVPLAQKFNISTSLFPPMFSRRWQQHSVFIDERGRHLHYDRDVSPIVSKWENATQCAERQLSFAKILSEHQWTFMFHDGGRFWSKCLLLIPLVIVIGFLSTGCAHLYECSRPRLCCLITVQVVAVLYIVMVICWDLVKYQNVLFEDGPYSTLLEQCGWPQLDELSPTQKLVQFLSFEFNFGALTSQVSMHYTQLATFEGIASHFDLIFLSICDLLINRFW